MLVEDAVDFSMGFGETKVSCCEILKNSQVYESYRRII